jgi:hypothetical protein
MKSAENAGTPAADVLPPPGLRQAEPDPTRRTAALTEMWLHAQTAARQTTRPQSVDRPLPWVTAPVPGTVFGADATYLSDHAQAIVDRRARLRADLAQAASEGHLPDWAQSLGPAPHEGAHRERWLDQVAVVAAFRDQYAPAIETPDRPLGPHPEPAPHTDHAHRGAHAAAALALARAWDLAHPTPRGDTARPGSEPMTRRDLELLRQLSTAAWSSLGQDEKISVAASMLARLGTWPAAPAVPEDGDPPATNGHAEQTRRPATGHRPDAAQTVSGLDEAVTNPHAVRHLYQALLDHGHLARDEGRPRRAPRAFPAGAAGKARRPSTPPRSRPIRGLRPQGETTWDPTRRAEPRHDYSPQPGHPQQETPGQPRPRW